jgi:predicted small lipoprotein YifL
VSHSYRAKAGRVVAAAVIGGVLSACGVKGELEPPPSTTLARPQGGQRAAAPPPAAGERVFTEQSSVQRVPSTSILPRNPPDEWSRSREYQSTNQPKTRAKEKAKTDEPFFLDPIL